MSPQFAKQRGRIFADVFVSARVEVIAFLYTFR
jgi:hypothetical protein